MSIKVKDRNGRAYTLTHTAMIESRQPYHVMLRHDLMQAITVKQKFKDGHVGSVIIFTGIFRHERSVLFPKNKRLYIGCRGFNLREANLILKWAKPEDE